MRVECELRVICDHHCVHKRPHIYSERFCDKKCTLHPLKTKRRPKCIKF